MSKKRGGGSPGKRLRVSLLLNRNGRFSLSKKERKRSGAIARRFLRLCLLFTRFSSGVELENAKHVPSGRKRGSKTQSSEEKNDLERSSGHPVYSRAETKKTRPQPSIDGNNHVSLPFSASLPFSLYLSLSLSPSSIPSTCDPTHFLKYS